MRLPHLGFSLQKPVFAAIIGLLLPLGTGAIPTPQGTFCGAKTGLVERNATYRESSLSRLLAARLAGEGKTFLYMRRTSMDAQTRSVLALISYMAVASGDKPLGDKTPPADKLTTDQLDAIQDIPAVAEVLKTSRELSEKSKPEPNWYFYSNSPSFKDYFSDMKLEAPEKGALLLTSTKGERSILAKTANDIIRTVGADVLIIEGEGGEELNPASMSSHPLILHLKGGIEPGSSQKSMDFNRMLGNADPTTTTFLFMMPETADEAKSWGFSDMKADAYAVNGKRILSDLNRYGLAPRVVKIKDRASMAAAVGGRFQRSSLRAYWGVKQRAQYSCTKFLRHDHISRFSIPTAGHIFCRAGL